MRTLHTILTIKQGGWKGFVWLANLAHNPAPQSTKKVISKKVTCQPWMALRAHMWHPWSYSWSLGDLMLTERKPNQRNIGREKRNRQYLIVFIKKMQKKKNPFRTQRKVPNRINFLKKHTAKKINFFELRENIEKLGSFHPYFAL